MSARVSELTQVVSHGAAGTELCRLPALAGVRSVRDRLASIDAPGGDEVTAVIYEVIREAVDQGLSGIERERAQMLMGLGSHQGQPAHDRRLAFARTYGPQLDWNNVRQSQAKKVLREIAQAMAGRLLLPPSDKARDKGYADWAENCYWLDERGVITLMESRRRVRALREGVDRASYTHIYYANPAQEVLSLGRSWGAAVANESWTGRGYLHFDLLFGFPLTRGEEHTFGYEVRVASSVPAHQLVQADEQSEESLLRCVFHPNKRPTHVWAFQNLVRQEAPGAAAGGKSLTLDISGMAHESFQSTQAGKVSGIGWKW